MAEGRRAGLGPTTPTRKRHWQPSDTQRAVAAGTSAAGHLTPADEHPAQRLGVGPHRCLRSWGVTVDRAATGREVHLSGLARTS